jgi:hypothetical protein
MEMIHENHSHKKSCDTLPIKCPSEFLAKYTNIENYILLAMIGFGPLDAITFEVSSEDKSS